MGALLGGAAVGGLVWAWPQVERFFFARFEAYQRNIELTRNALPVKEERHLADAELAEYERLRKQLKQAGEVLDEQIARREHVLSGGEAGDSPRRWRKGETK